MNWVTAARLQVHSYVDVEVHQLDTDVIAWYATLFAVIQEATTKTVEDVQRLASGDEEKEVAA